MLLSDVELRTEISEGRLVLDPPPSEMAIQSASIDLSFHNVFWRPRHGLKGYTVVPSQADPYKFMDREQRDEVELAPGDLILGETAEAISLPPHLAAWIEGKSGLARHGLLVHLTAPHIAPGWGTPNPKRITLELVNLSGVTHRLMAGEAIAQLLVTRLSSPSRKPYSGKHLARGS